MGSIREQEDDLFRRWRLGRSSFSPDGLVDETAYERSATKIVLLMKEVNDRRRSNFDLRDFLGRGSRCQTWDAVTRWVKGIRALESEPNATLPWSALGPIDGDDRLAYLRSVGVVNLRKAAGSHTTDNGRLVAAVAEDAHYLDEQMAMYEPDLVICCGSIVADLSAQVPCLNRGRWASTSRGIRFRRWGDRSGLLSYSHPAARVAAPLLFYGLMDAVREIGLVGRGIPQATP